MKIIDITRALVGETPPYPGDTPARIRPVATVARQGFNASEITLSSHTGTHIDAPRHFFADGKGLDDLPIDRFVVDTQVVEIRVEEVIRASDLEDMAIDPGIALLLKTRNGLLALNGFEKTFVHLGVDAAEWIVAKGVSLLGIDYYSVDPYGDRRQPAHHILLGAGVLVLENIVLKDVEPGRYRLICLPMKMKNADASPCRAVLIGQ